MLYLVDGITQLPIGTAPYIIGRQFLSDPTPEQNSFISRRHASVCWDSETNSLFVEDLGTLNGTFVNGYRTSGPVGEYTTFACDFFQQHELSRFIS